MSTTNEPRALAAALASPAFVTKGGGSALHAANRHVSRWAPEVGEAGANRIQPLRSLGFVDRLVSPWIESAQRSASLRMFSQYAAQGASERPTTNVSWVFPRPWYQDELDWMAAARAVTTQTQAVEPTAPQMLTTRGTYVAPQQQLRQSAIALPSALYEYVAPSLSIAKPNAPSVGEVYSPLVPLAATQAAHVMSRVMAPILSQSATAPAPQATAAQRMSPGLRAVLATMLERTASYSAEPTRVSQVAPELVTPPAPRPDVEAAGDAFSPVTQATQVADHYAEQRARIAELQRIARLAAEREAMAREATRADQVRVEQARTEARPADPGRIADVRAAEARAIEQRQAEIQQRAGAVAAQRQADQAVTDATRRETEQAAVAAERARIEERIAQRVAERTAVTSSQEQRSTDANRLHVAAREAAARDAVTAPVADVRATQAAAAPSPSRVAAEIAAVVASLPPELATMVAGSISARPDRAAQAIAELGDALRTVELIARSTAAGQTFESTRGPRVVMPAGLGGLVSTVERTTAQAGTSASRVQVPAAFARAAVPAAAPRAPRNDMRIPAMTFLAAPATSGAPAPTSALGATSAATPAALSHVAWSDRWLARFAGAKSTSLDVLSATSATPELRLEMLAAAAPGAVFVAPTFDEDRAAVRTPIAYADTLEPFRRTTDILPTLRNAAPAQAAVRIADDAETPDDVFAAISSAATRGRAPTATTSPGEPSRVAATTPASAFERETYADIVAHTAPSAPGAGLAAGLASSPFAAALRHVLPLPGAPAFDVRSLFGGGLGATYLAGLLSASTDEIATAASTMPTWATWGEAASALGDEQPVRDVAGFEPTYVAPQTDEVTADAEPTRIAAAQTADQVTTLRSALLSWNVETIAAQTGSPAETRVSTPTVTAATPTFAHSLIDAMALPMLGESAALRDLNTFEVAGAETQPSAYAAPGMIADRALGWSVAQERSTADLSYDFVSPELVLAARVYGLGPAEAAQAARLAVAGPGQLTAMASAVDRTFVQALAIDQERRGDRGATMYPRASGDVASVGTPAARGDLSVTSAARGDGAVTPASDAPFAAQVPSTSTFGVERRMPRGAFLWPAATTAALGLNAAAPDGELSMSVAALELLAAQAVAELGTYAAFGERALTIGADGNVTFTPRSGTISTGATGTGEGAEADVLSSAEAMVPTARREKFQALYLALSQSPSGRTTSPAARAARALALAGRGDDAITPRERAQAAWDVLPVVYGRGSGEPEAGESLSTGEAAVRQARRREELRSLDPIFVDGRPGLGALSARAGEALGSYVAPNATPSSSGSSLSAASRGDMGAMMRAPTAAQELVQTGRPAGRVGGGEVEIPPWFEAAARKMFEDRGSTSDGISLAELTLVQTAAPQQIAASSRHDGGSAVSSTPSPTGAAGNEKDKFDIQKVADDVFREVLLLMSIMRERNGEPYL